MAQITHRIISIHQDTYDQLRKLGDVTESFDDVLKKLLPPSGIDSIQAQTKERNHLRKEISNAR